MDDGPGTAPASVGHVLPLATVAVGALLAFRLGLLAGGLVAVDVVLALLGWWLASAAVAGGSLRSRSTDAWRRAWPPAIGALVLAWAWVLVTDSTRYDTRVRGEALGLVAGSGNWQLLLVGPVERSASRGASVLQPLWLVAVAVQLALVLALAWWATRPRARRHPGTRDPLVVVALALAVAALVVVAVQVVAGAGGQTMLLSTWSRAAAFFLGAALGALRPGPWTSELRAVVLGTRWIAAAVLVVLAVLAAPDSEWWTSGGVLVLPLVAAIVVAAAVPWPPGRRSRAAPSDIDPWLVLVSVWFLHGPAFALARSLVADAPAVAAGVLGLLVLAVATLLVVLVSSRLTWTPEAVERRCVLVPPVAVLLIVLLFSATGAFHWSGPAPRSDVSVAPSVPPR